MVSAVWCPSCLIVNKHLNELSKEMNLTITKIDYDLDEDIVEELQIGEVLPVIIYHDKRLIGEHTLNEIKEFLNETNA